MTHGRDGIEVVSAVRAALLISALLLITGCSKVKVSDIQSPYDQNLTYGDVIQEIRIEGNDYTRTSIINRAMASKVGEVYTEETAALDVKWLSQLGVFTSIHFDTIDQSDGVILVLSVTEVNPYIPAPSFKITEENGWEIGLAVSSPNLFGYASRLSAYVRGGGAFNVGVRFKDTWLPGRSWTRGYEVKYFHMERFNKIYDFDESSDEFLAVYQRNITNEWRFGPRVMFLSVKSKQPDITLDPDNRDNMPGLGLSVRYDTRNLQTYPTKGFWSELLATKTGGDANYWQGVWDVRGYAQLAGPRHSVAMYGLTTLTSGEVGTDIPIYMQFNIGGATTVRGWDLGSREGKNQFLGTVEYWWVIGRPRAYEIWFLKQQFGLQLSAFADVGTAWTTGPEFHRSWIGGGGVGVRLLTATGVTLRLDLAAGQSGLGINLFVGSQEKTVVQRDRVR